MGRAHCTYLADEQCTKIVRKPEEKRNLEEFRVNWKIILKFGA